MRAAADAAKLGQISTFDKLVIRGRVWADRAHRFTTLTVVGATFIAGCVTVYASGDMIIYNRRKRAEFNAEQKARYEAAIHTATVAIKSGTATEAQIEFMERDKAKQAHMAALANRKSIFKKGSEWLFSGLKKEEQAEVGGGPEALNGIGNSLNRIAKEEATGLKDKAKEAFSSEKKRQVGGPLDQLGTSAETAMDSSKSGGWMSFITRRS